jgi:hypothetical protein
MSFGGHAILSVARRSVMLVTDHFARGLGTHRRLDNLTYRLPIRSLMGPPFAGSWGQGGGLNDRGESCPESGF